MDMTPQAYQQYVQQKMKKSPIWKDVCLAFVIGGAICVLGQAIQNGWAALGLSKDDAGTAASCSLVALSSLLTGLNLYNKLARFGGAGTLVPITGFSNAVTSPALDFKADVRCIIRIVRENRDRRVSGLNPTKFIGKEVLEAAIIPHEFRLPRSQMGVADPSGSSFSEYYTHRRSYHATRSIVL